MAVNPQKSSNKNYRGPNKNNTNKGLSDVSSLTVPQKQGQNRPSAPRNNQHRRPQQKDAAARWLDEHDLSAKSTTPLPREDNSQKKPRGSFLRKGFLNQKYALEAKGVKGDRGSLQKHLKPRNKAPDVPFEPVMDFSKPEVLTLEELDEVCTVQARNHQSPDYDPELAREFWAAEGMNRPSCLEGLPFTSRNQVGSMDLMGITLRDGLEESSEEGEEDSNISTDEDE